MKTKEEIKKWLLKNCINQYGDLDLSKLDFSDFVGDVFICEMKVGKNLYQNWQQAKGNLYQNFQFVGGDLQQDDQEVGGRLIQDKYSEGKNE